MNYFTNPYMQQPVMPTPTYTNGGNLFFVGSEEEAKSWIVNPNQTVYLLDRNNSMLYIKSVEKNGMAQPLESFKLSLPQTVENNATAEYATKQDIEDLKIKIKEIKNEYITNGSTTEE